MDDFEARLRELAALCGIDPVALREAIILMGAMPDERVKLWLMMGREIMRSRD